MIIVSEEVDGKAQQVRWTLSETEPDHEFNGQACHAIDEATWSRKEVLSTLRKLGYEPVGAEVKDVGFYRELVQYWARL